MSPLGLIISNDAESVDDENVGEMFTLVNNCRKDTWLRSMKYSKSQKQVVKILTKIHMMQNNPTSCATKA